MPMRSPVEAAESAYYDADTIEEWLISQIESTEISFTAPTASLDASANTMTINASATARGTTAELNDVIFTFDGSKNVSIEGESSVVGKNPRFSCKVEMECKLSDKIPQLKSISDIQVGGSEPSLSEDTLNNIADIINEAIEASELKMESLGGDLTGIDVITESEEAKLELKWSGGSAKWDKSTIEDKLNEAADELVDQANDYLSNGYDDGRWSLNVTIGSGKLTFNAEATALSQTAEIEDMVVTFSDTTASISDKISIGGKQVTVNGTVKITCTNYVPDITVKSIGVGNEYPGFRDWIEDPVINSALGDALSRLAENIIDDTGLECHIKRFNRIAIVGERLKVWWHKAPTPGPLGPTYYYLKTDLFDIEKSYHISSTGKISMTIEATSRDGMLTITIPKDTVVLDKYGKRLESLTVAVDKSPPEPPADARIIGLAYDFAPAGAKFDPLMTLTWKYDPDDLPEGVAEANLCIAYYNENTGKWNMPLKSIAVPEKNLLLADVSHFTTFAIVGYLVPPEIAIFSISNLSIEPPEVYSGKPVSITVLVTNTGGKSGTYPITLKIAGKVESTKDVIVAAGSNKTASFTVIKEELGIYQVEVEGLKGSFTVKGGVAPAPLSWISHYWWAILVGVVLIGLLAYFLRRRRALS